MPTLIEGAGDDRERRRGVRRLRSLPLAHAGRRAALRAAAIEKGLLSLLAMILSTAPRSPKPSSSAPMCSTR
ncbi:MAG: hypothetical protein WDM84_07715 [Bauldia sp.]